MAIFGKNNDEVDAKDEEKKIKREVGENHKFSKNLKDLNSKNKKKRKEPPKPWGKKERLTVLLTLLATLIASFILAANSRGLKIGINFDAGQIKFDLQPLNIFGEKTIIIQKK